MVEVQNNKSRHCLENLDHTGEELGLPVGREAAAAE
jgi:hypothetical protein